MAHIPPSRRGDRLKILFYKVLSGEQLLANSQTAMRFIEAICNQVDPVQCVQKLIGSPRGLSALQSALRLDISPRFINTSVAPLIRYFQAHDLAVICQGNFLRDIVRTLTEPSIFWDAFVKAQNSDCLSDEALQCFSWLLLQLISLPADMAQPYYGIAKDQSLLKKLLQSTQLEIRTFGQKIIHIMNTITNPEQFEGNGPGGRHDNDFEDIRKIAIMPTPDEIASKEPPYLRRAMEIDECSSSGRLAMHIDNQFRLLREDMLRDLREELQVALGVRAGRRKGLYIAGLKIEGLECNERQRWGLRLKCEKDLPQLGKKKPDARKKYITENRNFVKHQSLACLLADGEVAALVTINRSEDLLAHNPPIVCVQFSGREDCIAKALLALKSANDIGLIQLNTAMFAYEPVLKQLQETKQLELNDEVMLWTAEQELRMVPAADNDSILDLIGKLRRNVSCELQTHLGLSKSTQLDASQAACLVDGLTRRVSLMQGPPGTGKSFIGALIAKAIYKYSQEKILVVCYTNHALDQFLEDLLDVNIPAETVVRLGSHTKSSTRIQPLLLSAQNGKFKPRKDYWDVMNKRKADLAQESTKLRAAFAEYYATAVSRSELMQYLEFNAENPPFHDAFTLPMETDGMQRVGRRGRNIDDFYLLDRWAKGLNSGVYQNEGEYPEVWQMSPVDRSMALRKWKSDIINERVINLCNCGEQYNKSLTDIDALFSEKDRGIMEMKRFIGCTTTAAAKYVQTIRSASPNVLLVEEAGEILESHILTALGHETGQLILIGDHKQLRPKAHFDLSVEKEEGYDLNRSLFERLILRGYPHQVLSQQHRMRPEISSLVRQLTYPELTDAHATKSRPNLRGFQDNLIFLNHENLEDETPDTFDFKDGNSTSSKSNSFEASMTLRCVRYLGQQGYGTDKIVILTPYVAQLRLLFDVLAMENDPVLNDLDSYDLVRAGLMPAATAKMQKRQINISTVDNYQGEESDIVVVSLTRSNQRGDIGFMSSPERLNVLLSRARNALILIGNAKTFEHSRRGKDLWSKLFHLLKDGSHIYDGFPVKCERHPDRKLLLCCPENFDECPDGGCSEPCDVLLNCGTHLCPQRCHQLFDHSKTVCLSVVRSSCPIGHAQSWRCGEGKPAACRACENEKKAREKKRQEEFLRQLKREKEQEEFASQMTRLEEELRQVREAAADARKSKEMAQSLEQRRRDLENAKRLVEAMPSVTTTAGGANAGGATAENHTPPEGAPHTPIQPIVADATDPSHSQSEVQPSNSPSEADWDRQKRIENASNDAIDSLMEMTGLEEVKAQVLKIKAKIDTALRQSRNLKEERYGVVLLGNPGTGKTTVARLYAKFLTSMNVLDGSEFIETSGSRLANEGVDRAKKHIETLVNAGGGCLFVDESYQLSSGNSYGGASVLDFLLAEIENQVGKIVFIFAGYNKQMEKFFEHNPGLTSRMPYRLQFADYNDSELLQMLARRIQKTFGGKMRVEGGCAGLYARIAVRRLGRGRSREGFGNARALENVLARILERQADRLQTERAAGARPDDFLLKKEDLIGPEPSTAIVKSAAWKELQGLIGLKAVKESMQGLLDRIHTNYQRELKEKEIIEVSLNRLFLGSPGTGKTSVGKLYGQVLADMGLLSNGEVVIKNPADFVGSVLGESEKNTKAILKATEGKTLIIDEFYMLNSGAAGQSAASDPYKSAVIDTIVAEVQSTLGEDRCVLLLGYQDQMEEMFRNTNPGLARRFALDDAFYFEDFDDDQLRKIMELKLKKQGLDATKEAKDVAISILGRSRQRLNFGNAGEVENMISHAKAYHQSRESKLPISARSTDVVFEPQDFDANFDRSSKASINCRELFKDVLGCEDIVGKLEGFLKTSSNMKARGIDPREHIPFNFIFKGPPGTGKTTTARKMGQVYYDMGFLSTAEVHECSATDLVGGFVGHTGPKTIKLLEKALGRVLFIDEAYRLGEGQFAREAVNELVDSLTKPRFAGKIVVILAGYENDMNELLSLNQGLSSRFSEEVVFTNMEPEDCWRFLQRNLQKTGITVEPTDHTQPPSEIIYLFRELSTLPSWGNGRDVQTISKTIMGSVFQATSSRTDSLMVSSQQVVDFLSTFLADRRARSKTSNARTLQMTPNVQAVQELIARPKATKASQATTVAKQKSPSPPAPPREHSPVPPPPVQRDAGVPDAIWSQLQADKAAQEEAERGLDASVAAVENARNLTAFKATIHAKKVARLEEQKAKAKDEEYQEFKRQHEAARLKHLAAKQAQEEAAERLRKVQEEVERKRKEEAKVQVKLREMGVCEMGFQWIRQADGYRCSAGGHFVGNGQLGI